MRIDTKLNALQRVMRNDTFILEAEGILNNQYVKVQNWSNVCVALQVLTDIDWLPYDQYKKLLDDYLENRGDSDTLEVPADEYHILEQAVKRYNPGLPIVVNTLRAHAVSASEDTIWVEIASASDPTELADIMREIEKALNIAGQVDASFKFVGVAQGSDWLGFVPNSDLAGLALNYCIGLAASISTELLKVAGPVMNAIVRLDLDSDEDPSEEEIEKRLRDIKDRTADVMIEDGVRLFTEHLEQAQYPPEIQNQVGVAIRATTKSVREMAESNRAVFEVSDSGRNIVVGIHGNNNHITIQNFPQIPVHRDALTPAESNESSTSD